MVLAIKYVHLLSALFFGEFQRLHLCRTILILCQMFLPNKDTFILKVHGDSMINVGFFEGDYLIVEKTDTANNGDIVVAMLEDEATVKRFFKENGHFRLQPENDEFEPIITNEVAILGKVVSLIRYY